MQPTSLPQFHAAQAFGIPPVERVRDDVWALAQPMPGDHLPCSFLYLLRDADGEFHVVDPGWDSADNWAAFVAFLGDLGAGPSDIRTITATHLHADHLGMASRMRDASGAILQLHVDEAAAVRHGAQQRLTADVVERQAEVWQVPVERREELFTVALGDEEPRVAPTVDRVLADGDHLDVPGFDLVALHTPGHTTGHLCLRDDARSLMFTGDHLLPHLFAGLGLGGSSASNPLADYVESTARMTAFADHEALPGHGYRFSGLAERAEESAAHHLARTAEVEAIVGRDPATPVWDIARQLTWTAGFENLYGFTLHSALRQTEMHRDYVADRR